MGRIKQSRVNSNRARTRARATSRDRFVPVYEPSPFPLMRLRQQAKALLRKSRAE